MPPAPPEERAILYTKTLAAWLGRLHQIPLWAKQRAKGASKNEGEVANVREKRERRIQKGNPRTSRRVRVRCVSFCAAALHTRKLVTAKSVCRLASISKARMPAPLPPAPPLADVTQPLTLELA